MFPQFHLQSTINTYFVAENLKKEIRKLPAYNETNKFRSTLQDEDWNIKFIILFGNCKKLELLKSFRPPYCEPLAITSITPPTPQLPSRKHSQLSLLAHSMSSTLNPTMLFTTATRKIARAQCPTALNLY